MQEKTQLDFRICKLLPVFLVFILLFSLLSCISYGAYYTDWNAEYENDLIVWFRFDNDSSMGESNSLIKNLAGGINGTAENVSYENTDCISGNCLQLNGVNARVLIKEGINYSFPTGQSFTLSGWIKSADTDTDGGIGACMIGDGSYGSAYCLGINDGTIYNLKMEGADSGAQSNAFSQNLTDEILNWHHITGIRDAPTDRALLFLDGVLVSNETDNTVGTIGNDSAWSMAIGYGANSGIWVNGTIDEVMIWNKSLTSEEVLDIYTQQKDDCVIPYENMSITTNTTLCNGTYYLNDTEGNGAIIIAANDVELDLNGAVIKGNGTTSSRGIFLNRKNNTIIKNGNIKNFDRGINIQNSNNTLVNNMFINDSPLGINFVANYPIFSNSINNTVIYNSTSRGISLGSNNYNYTISYVNISYSSTAIWIDSTSAYNTILNYISKNNSYALRTSNGGNYTTVKYSYLANSTNSDIWLDDSFNCIINENYIDKGSYQTNNGIYLSGISKYNSIKNNNITTAYYGISFSEETTYSNASYNILYNNYQAIRFGDNATYNIMNNNVAINCSWNCLQFYSTNNRIYDNYIENFQHNGIDTHNNDNFSKGGNTEIFNNNITLTDTTNFPNATWGIHLNSGYNNSVHNNRIYNITSDNGRGIASTNSNASHSNRIYDNLFDTITEYCIYDSGKNNSYENNNFTNCGVNEVRVFGNDYINSISQPSFINNNFLDGYSRYYFSNQFINVSINETSSSYHLINLSNNGIVKFNYNGRKDLSVENNSIKIYNLPTNSQIYNGTQEAVLAESVTDYNLTIPANNRTLVLTFDYTISEHPRLSALPTNLTNISAHMDNGIFRVDCKGDGFNTTNMNSLGTGIYDVYKDGVFQEQLSSNTYNCSTCSSYTFIPAYSLYSGWSILSQYYSTDRNMSNLTIENMTVIAYWNRTNSSFTTYVNGTGINAGFSVPKGEPYYAYLSQNMTTQINYTYTEQNYTLDVGWNILMEKNGSTFNQINASLAGNVSAISYWNASNQYYYSAVTAYSVRMTYTIPYLHGYWLYITSNSSWSR